MNDDIYMRICSALRSEDFFTIAYFLSEFVEFVMKQKNRKKYVDYFVARMYDYALFDDINVMFSKEEKQNYCVSSLDMAVAKYLMIKLQPITTPVKMLRKIKAMADEMKSMYELPKNPHIELCKLKEIMTYLDGRYSFSNKIFRDKRAMFIILNTAHKLVDSETVVFGVGDYIEIHFLLYCMVNNPDSKIRPEGVLFHELGHAVHARWTGDTNVIPDEILDWLKKLCFPTIDELSIDVRKEIMADVIAEGLTYKSPYECYEPYSKIPPQLKEVFSKLVQQIMDSISTEGKSPADGIGGSQEHSDKMLSILMK